MSDTIRTTEEEIRRIVKQEVQKKAKAKKPKKQNQIDEVMGLNEQAKLRPREVWQMMYDYVQDRFYGDIGVRVPTVRFEDGEWRADLEGMFAGERAGTISMTQPGEFEVSLGDKDIKSDPSIGSVGGVDFRDGDFTAEGLEEQDQPWEHGGGPTHGGEPGPANHSELLYHGLADLYGWRIDKKPDGEISISLTTSGGNRLRNKIPKNQSLDPEASYIPREVKRRYDDFVARSTG